MSPKYIIHSLLVISISSFPPLNIYIFQVFVTIKAKKVALSLLSGNFDHSAKVECLFIKILIHFISQSFNTNECIKKIARLYSLKISRAKLEKNIVNLKLKK